MTDKSFDHELPETLLIVPSDRTGIPIDAITAACTRAEAVLDMLMLHFNLPAGHERLSEAQESRPRNAPTAGSSLMKIALYEYLHVTTISSKNHSTKPRMAGIVISHKQ